MSDRKRIWQLPESGLETSLENLERQFTELRAGSPQFTGGASLVRFSSQTGATFDWTGLLNDPGGIGIGGKLFQVTATPVTMPAFWGGCVDDLYVDTSTSTYGGLEYITDYKNNNAPIGVAYTDIPNTTVSSASKSWFVQLSGKSTRTIWIKFRVYGLDNANVVVTALS